jgi:hypothetical protein
MRRGQGRDIERSFAAGYALAIQSRGGVDLPSDFSSVLEFADWFADHTFGDIHRAYRHWRATRAEVPGIRPDSE